MFSWAPVFWLALVALIFWSGWILAFADLGAFYHPMPTLGDFLWPLRKWSIVVPIASAITMLSIWLWRGPLASVYYLVGTAILAITALLPFFPEIDNGYRQVYWLDDTRYEIPWQYGPYNGSPERGGKYFLVKVSVPDFIPKYKTQKETIIIGKAVDFNHGKGGTAPDEICIRNHPRLECQWKRGDSVFIASGKKGLFPPEISDFMVSVADLLDSFEISEPPER